MSKRILWMLPAILAFLSPSGCTSPTTNEVSLGQEFTLAVGQSVVIAGENFTIKFIEVTSDSRCPQGVTCVWAGEASCLIEITDSESTYRKVLTLLGLSGPSQTDFKEYQIAFDLQPYPQAGKEIESEEYRLQLIISKKPG